MGSAISQSFHSPPPSSANAPPYSGDLLLAEQKVDYMNLPCPVPYKDLRLEASRILKPTDFEGLHVVLLNKLNDKFLIANKVAMEWMEVPNLPVLLKVCDGVYEFGSFYIDPQLLIGGKINTYGILKTRVKYFTNNFSCDINAKLTNEPNCLQSASRFEFKGTDYRSQFQIGTNGLYGANYIQNVNQNLSLGTQLRWVGDQNKSVLDFAARYSTSKMIASGQVSDDGSLSLSYVQNLSEKVSLASEFKYMPTIRDAISSFGYEYKFGDWLLRGKVDSNAVISSYYERNIASGMKLLLFAQIDHGKKDYKFGYGVELVRGKLTIPNWRALLHKVPNWRELLHKPAN